MEPERLRAALALDEDDVPELAGLPQARQPVQAELRALLPAELVVAVERDAEADRLLVPVTIDVRHPHGRRVRVLRIRETERAEEVDREALGLGVRLERARAQPLLIRLQRCNSPACTPPRRPCNTRIRGGMRVCRAVLQCCTRCTGGSARVREQVAPSAARAPRRSSSTVQPAWHLSRTRPSSPSPIESAACLSSCAGQRATQPVPDRFTRSSRSRNSSTVIESLARACSTTTTESQVSSASWQRSRLATAAARPLDEGVNIRGTEQRSVAELHDRQLAARNQPLHHRTRDAKQLAHLAHAPQSPGTVHTPCRSLRIAHARSVDHRSGGSAESP